jgi:Fic family protein
MNRAGGFMKALSGELEYEAYKPKKLPPSPNINMDNDMVKALVEAHGLLSRLDTMADLLPDRDLFLGAEVRKEALLSSQIEGTQATMEDILSPNSEKSANLEVDDVVNYVDGLNFAIRELRSLPISKRLLCSTHAVLMKGVRGEEKSPGEFRRSQNWIGGAGGSLKNARYIPPTADDMLDGMSDLERYINEDRSNPLLKAALAHYQFETIHPFLDGNGRIGRMLITLMLLSEGEIKNPILYMSLFLKGNRVEYYDRLSEVRKSGDYEQWVLFFLGGVSSTCRDGIDEIGKISSLIDEDTKKTLKARSNTRKVYGYLKEHPIIDIKTTAKALGLSFNTVSSALSQLSDLGIAEKMGNEKRGRLYSYAKYVEILKAGT